MIKRVKVTRIHEPVEITDYIGAEERENMIKFTGRESPVNALLTIGDHMIKRMIAASAVWLVAINYNGDIFTVRAYINGAGTPFGKDTYAIALLAGFMWYGSNARHLSGCEFFNQLEDIAEAYWRQHPEDRIQ